MRFENRLVSFEPTKGLNLSILPATHVEFQDDETTYAHFGFRERSKQSRFFTDATTANRIVALLYQDKKDSSSVAAAPPTCMTDSRVVARLFGTLDRDSSLELWHISVNASHPLNDSGKGTRWGVHNVESYDVNGKTRWKTISDGKNITARIARAHVRGSPNPYAVECLVGCAMQLNCPSVRQHDDMPCAKLFNCQYDQKTHPATMLIYETLGFGRAPGLSHYTWHGQVMPPLFHAYTQMRERMMFGLSVV